METGLTLPEYRSLMATDLKVTIDTEMSTAELNRAVQRAVNDMSRYFPWEKVHEETFDFEVDNESITTPATADPDAVVDAADISATSSGDTLTITDRTPDVPRRLTVTLTDASNNITELTVLIKGYDQDNNYTEERWTLPQLAAGSAVQGDQYFKYVEEVEVDNIAGNTSGETLDVGTGNAYDSWIFLANKPIDPNEDVVVTSDPAGTTYTQDTDYRVDYSNGAIKFINGGNMAAGTGYLVNYSKSPLGLYIGDLLPIVTRITKVQYPVDNVPQQFVSFNIVGNFMYVASKYSGQSQAELTDEEHIAVWYERHHMPPGESSPGSYPAILDEVIVMGAAGYALLTEAQEYEQQAATDLSSLRTELGLTTDIHTLADAALDKIATYLESNTGDDAKEILADITDKASELRDKVEVAVDAMATYLGKVSTVDLDASTGADSAVEALKKYEDYIDAVNVGARVGELGADYAGAWANIAAARIQAAQSYAQEANLRLSNLRSYIEESSGWVDIANGFITEGQARIAEIQSHLAEAGQWSETVNGDLVLADRFRTEGLARLNEFHTILKNKAEARRRTTSVPTRQPA